MQSLDFPPSPPPSPGVPGEGSERIREGIHSNRRTATAGNIAHESTATLRHDVCLVFIVRCAANANIPDHRDGSGRQMDGSVSFIGFVGFISFIGEGALMNELTKRHLHRCGERFVFVKALYQKEEFRCRKNKP